MLLTTSLPFPLSLVSLARFFPAAAIGTREYAHFTQFDNIQLYTSYVQCGATPLKAGAPVSIVHCAAEVGLTNANRWDFTPSSPGGMTGTFSLRSDATLCLAAAPNATAGGAWWLSLAACNSQVS